MIKLLTKDLRAGETKRLVVSATDALGQSTTLQALEAQLLRPDGSTTTFTLADFALTAEGYEVALSFDLPGSYRLTITATDALGNTEIEELQFLVYP